MKNGNNIADKTTGERIERLRKEKGYVTLTDKNGTEIKQKLTQEYLATHYLNFEGVRQYRNYIKNKTPIPIDRLCVLADLFKVSVDYLLLRTDYTTADNEMISKVTGLSDDSIENLKALYNAWAIEDYNLVVLHQLSCGKLDRLSQVQTYKNALNRFLSDEHLNEFVYSLNLLFHSEYKIPVDFKTASPDNPGGWYQTINQRPMENIKNGTSYMFFAKSDDNLSDNLAVPVTNSSIESLALKGIEVSLLKMKTEKAKKKSPKP